MTPDWRAHCQVNAPGCWTNASQKHHRKLRSQGGTDDPLNLLDVCPSCHTYVHDHPTLSYEYGWMLHAWQDDVPVVRAGAELRARF